MLSEQEFINLYKHPKGRSSFEEVFLKRLYPQVKPHLRQPFPREAILKALAKITGPGAGDGGFWYTIGKDEALDALERLWNGGERGKPDSLNCEDKKKVLCTSPGCPDCQYKTHWVPCPKCKPCQTCGGSIV